MKTFIEQLKKNTPILEQAYFKALQDNTFEKADFITSQQHFFYAVVHFSRPMLALASRLPEYSQRWVLLRNIIEEHGNGNLNNTHGDTFLRFLESFGAAPVFSPHFCVESFNLSLDEICGHRDWRLGVACLGIIEDRFAEISNFIHQHVVEKEWSSADEIQYYRTHKKLDTAQANELYSLLTEEWVPAANLIQQGLQLGNDLFLALYEHLYLMNRHR